MIKIIICLGAGLLLGGLILYLCLRPRLKRVVKLNEEIQQENEKLSDQRVQLSDECNDLRTELESLRITKSEKTAEISILDTQKEAIKQTINDLKEQAQNSAKIFEEQAIELANTNIEQAVIELGKKYQEAEDNYRQKYEIIIGNSAAAYKLMADEQQAQIDKLLDSLIELKAKNDSAVEAAKRAEEIRTAADFYKLQLTDIDLHEIELLRNVAPYLRDKEPLNKVIWKCYYENPTSDLIGRVIGSGTHTGIYKITNLKNNMCYVGQAVNIGR